MRPTATFRDENKAENQKKQEGAAHKVKTGPSAQDLWKAKYCQKLPDGRYDEKHLGQEHDPYDGAVYAAAERRFWADVRAQGLGRRRCLELCPGVEHLQALPEAYV